MLTPPYKLILLVILGGFLAAAFGGRAHAQLTQGIKGFSADAIHLYREPTEEKSSTYRITDAKRAVSGFGAADTIRISGFFPGNGLVELSLANGRQVYVRGADVIPMDKVRFDRAMGESAPPGCRRALVSAGASDSLNRQTATSRGLGGC